MIRSVFRKLAILGAGFAIGLLLRSTPSDRSSPARLPEPADVAPEGVRTPPKEGRAEGEGSPSAPLPGETHASMALSELIGSIPAKPTLQGNGVISGRVLTDSGGPLAGVLIDLKPHLWFDKWPAPEDFGWKGLADSGHREAFTFFVLVKSEDERKRTTLTNESGAFRFDGLSEGIPYSVQASLEGWEIPSLIGSTYSLHCGEEIQFVARRLAAPNISVRCVLRDGREPADAHVTLLFPEAGRSSARHLEWLPSRREFSLAPGIYLVHAEATVEGLTYRSDRMVFTIGLEPRDPIALILLPDAGPGIDCELHFAPGAPQEIIPVYVERIATPDEARLELGRSPRAVVDPAKSTHCSIDHLSPGLHYVAALWGHQGPLAAEAIVEVGDRRVDLELHLQPPDLARGFAIAAYSPEGDPLSPEGGFWAVLEGIAARGQTCFVGQTIHLRTARTAEGSFRFFAERSLDSMEEEGPLTWILAVYTKEYGPLRIPFDPRKEREAHVRFQVPALPTFSIDGYAEGGYRRGELDVEINPSVESPAGRCFSGTVGYGTSDAQGRSSLGPVQPGSYQLHILFEPRPSSLQLRQRVHRSIIDLPPGANEFSVSLPPLHDLAVSCPNAQEGERITLCRRWSLSGWSIELTGERIAIFPGLPDGEYLLRMEGPNGGEMDVVLPGQETIEFRPSPFNAFVIEWIRDGSYVGEIGIESNERIVGLGAELFEEAQDFKEIIGAHRDEEEITLLLQGYDGRRRSVPASPARLLADMETGTLIRPTRR